MLYLMHTHKYASNVILDKYVIFLHIRNIVEALIYHVDFDNNLPFFRLKKEFPIAKRNAKNIKKI